MKPYINNLSLSEKIDLGIKKAITKAIQEHKQLNHSIYVEINGKVVKIPSNKIKVPK